VAVAPAQGLKVAADQFQGFFSYAHHDAETDPELVRSLTERLELRVGAKLVNAEFNIWRDVDDVRTGEIWDERIMNAVRTSSVFIVLLTPKWIGSAYCRREYRSFQQVEDGLGPAEYVVPLLARTMENQVDKLDGDQLEIYNSLQRRQYKKTLAANFLLLSANEREHLVDEVADDIARMLERLRRAPPPRNPGRPHSPAPPGALSNIPITVPRHFLGRDDALAAIDAALEKADGRAAITAALHGLRGVGKTTLAAAYAERHRDDYRATWWIRAQTEPSMRADLVALGVRLGWTAPDEKEEPALAAVRERLSQEGDGILLIFDNAVDAASIGPYLPHRGGARVLVTSNSHVWQAVAAPVEIRQWPKEIGADFLMARIGRAGERERAGAEALSETLGGLPLAHEQAGAYCERLGVSFADYRKRFLAAPVRLLDDARHVPAAHNDGMTAAKSFALAIEEAAKLHPAAEPLIVHAALLAPEPIPLFLFAEGREEFGEPLASALAGDGLDEAVAALRAFALVDKEAIPDERDPAITTYAVRLHRLVREVAAARWTDERRDRARRALVSAMRAVYPQGVYGDPRTWPRARRLDALALALVSGDEGLAGETEVEVSYVADRLATYRQTVLAAYGDARPLFERALAIRKKARGPEHPDTASSLNNLALLLQKQGDLVAARPLYERALEIGEKVQGPDHPATATRLNNLAGLLRHQGDVAGARPLYERALAIREKVLGPEHRDVAQSLSNLAVLLRVQGDFAAAQPLHERALAIREKVLGPEHPDVAQSLNNLAFLLKAQGDLAAARPLYKRALAIREKVLGPEHPDVAQILNNFAVLLSAQGDLAAARRLCERALAIREKVLGSEHPDTVRVRENLALLIAEGG
jgi:tetratricopeptide (TPR) repeat protein